MGDRKRILLTGASGYIGHAVLRELSRAGKAGPDSLEVFVLSRNAQQSAASEVPAANPSDVSVARAGSPETLRASAADLRALLPAERVIVCDLLDGAGLTEALAPLAGKIDVIIHCAAARSTKELRRASAPGGAAARSTKELRRASAPGGAAARSSGELRRASAPGGESCADPNQAMVVNLLQATQSFVPAPRWIHLSSVAVYGAAGRSGAIQPDAELRPGDAYGKSKLACETRLMAAPGLSDLRILRVTPVFSPEAPRNIMVRVYLPGTPLRLRVWPEPRHSLLALDTLVAAVVEHVTDSAPRRLVENLTDSKPYSQHSLLERCGNGCSLPILELMLRPIYWTCYLIPGKVGYRLRCFYWKLFRSNVYARGQLHLP